MKQRMATQIVLELSRRDAFTAELLADAAECCLDALQREAQFVAFGPAVSADLARGVIQVECTVAADDPSEVDGAQKRIGDVALAALARLDYDASASTLHAIPA